MSSNKSTKNAEWATTWLGDGFPLLASKLREIHDNNPELFLSAAQHIGISRRMAYDLIAIDKAFQDLKVDVGRVADIGWSKARLLSKHITKKNCNALLGLAETTTVRELSLILKKQVLVPGTRTVLMYLTPEQHAVFEKALLAHGAIKVGKGLIDKEEALIRALSSAKS